MKNFYILCWIIIFTVSTIGGMMNGGDILTGFLVWMFVGLIIPAAYLE